MSKAIHAAIPPLPPGSGAQPLRGLARLLMGDRPGSGTDWAAILQLARAYHVSALLCWRLREAGWQVHRGNQKAEMPPGCEPPGVPPEIQAALTADLRKAAVHAMRAETELAQILAALQSAQVPVVVLKGATLAARYPHEALRSYGDLDLLIPREQMAPAERVLGELGYRTSRHHLRDWTLDNRHHFPPMTSEAKALDVELHWRLSSRGGVEHIPIPIDALWARAVPWQVQGQTALRFSDLDLALHVCHHGAVLHRMQLGLQPLLDLAFLVDGWDREQWQTLTSWIERYGQRPAVALLFSLAQELFGPIVPREVLDRLAPAGEPPWPGDMPERLLLQRVDSERNLSRVLLAARAQNSVGARLRRLLWHLFLPRPAMAATYGVPANSPRIWLAYAWRPVDLMRRYGGTVWNRLTGDPATRATRELEVWLQRWLAADEAD